MFAEGNAAVLREWKGILESQGWRGTVQRLNELCEFLVDVGLTWRMLGLMGDPSEWAPQFSAQELQGVKALAKRKPSRSRLFFHLCVGSGHEICIRSPKRDTREAKATRGQGVPGVPASQLRRSGPKSAQAFLCKTFGGAKDRQTWVKSARVHAILGGMSLSLDPFSSGMRCYFGFVGWYAVCA